MTNETAVLPSELIAPSMKPQEVSFTLPKALHTTAHVHLNFLDHCAMVFLATSSPADSGGTTKPMGSFVYAMPDVSIYPPHHFPQDQPRFSQSYHHVDLHGISSLVASGYNPCYVNLG